MITLGGIDLVFLGESEPIWTDRYTQAQVQQDEFRTLGGRLVVGQGPLIGGQRATLKITENKGLLTKDKVLALYALSGVPGAVYTLVFGAQSLAVQFDFSSGAAVNFNPVTNERSNDNDSEDLYAGEIRLMTV